MSNITKQQFAGYVQEFQLRELFIDGLGWNIDRTTVQPLEIDGIRYAPRIIADKNGFKIIECRAVAVPPYPVRIQVLNALKTRFAELLVIFTDNKLTRQEWLYSYKVAGQNKKAQCEYRIGQDPQALYERTAGMFFSLDEEGNITILDVINRVRSNFTANSERVTRRFYSEFKTQHTALLGFIQGITENVDKEWYASIMLNRLMFCYFMQKRGFLDNNRNYLRHKLVESKAKLGKGKFFSFYRSFLMTLFQKGFGTYEHTPDIKAMIGNIPYLNGGLFDLHEIERHYPDIDISDEAFERIFDLFDRYEWHLDTRECASGNEINPDVLGYIFEKYINDRAAMGAYYTQEDITGYISRSTILPYLLEATKKAYSKPFEANGTVWKFLRESGERYIFESVRCGVNETLPDSIAIGLNTSAPNLIERRKDWNKPVPDDVDHLPTEIWREFIERTNRCRATLGKITSGAICEVSDFITYNLDIVSFVGDLLDTIEDPKFIQMFYAQLEKVTILDPTCGSGAFLFAALNILEPLYDSCLNRMADYLSHDYKGILERSTKRFFDKRLEQMESDIHPSKDYFIYKSIILNNLYGVDIMNEAVETAKLRLFLKLVSTAEPNYRAANIGIEPLPDIDFNIKAGNSLIGYANEQEVQDGLLGNLIGMTKISETMDAMLKLSKAVSRYKQLQLGEGDYRADDFKEAKAELSAQQTALRITLDKLLRENDYPAVSDEAWLNSYQPFHWVSEFYSIIAGSGGFDVIIGNPPYVEYSATQKKYRINGYDTIACGNLYAFVIERADRMLAKTGLLSFIIPSASVCTPRMRPLSDYIGNHLKSNWISVWDERPAKLFDGVDQQLCVQICARNTMKKGAFITSMRHWHSEEREHIFHSFSYEPLDSDSLYADVLPKFSTGIEKEMFLKLGKHQLTLAHLLQPGNDSLVYFKNAGGRYWRLIKSFETHFKSDAGARLSSTEKNFNVMREYRKCVVGVLSSSLFYFFWRVTSNCRHLTNRELFNFPIANALISEPKISALATQYEDDLQKNATRQVTRNRISGEIEQDVFRVKLSKPIIDQIDTVLAEHYGFTEEELDYIINYDIKYRMGLGGAANADDDE